MCAEGVREWAMDNKPGPPEPHSQWDEATPLGNRYSRAHSAKAGRKGGAAAAAEDEEEETRNTHLEVPVHHELCMAVADGLSEGLYHTLRLQLRVLLLQHATTQQGGGSGVCVRGATEGGRSDRR